MVIRMERVLEKGWKETENNRFGFCLVIRFVDTETNKILFRYAPLLKDIDEWGISFDSLIKLDDLHKEYMHNISELGLKFSTEVKEECKPIFTNAKELIKG